MGGVSASLSCINPVIKKHCKLNFFKTVNQSLVIWDQQYKPKGVFGGHINIRSLTPKADQVHHLLENSNLDFLCLSETWLHSDSPSAALHVPGYKILDKIDLMAEGVGS